MALVTPGIASLQPYVPGKPVEELERELGIHGALKLASNENPLGPSPRAIEAMRQEATQVHYYPEGDGPALKQGLAEHLGVPAEEIVLGNGSNEILDLCVRTFATSAHHAVISQKAFLVYPMALTAAGVAFDAAPTGPDRGHDLAAMRALVRPNTRLVFIANPNNPTGTYVTRPALEAFLRGLPDELVVILDEAYFEYVDRPDYPDGVALRHLHPNVVVTRTFSKCYGLAGLRIGYGVMRPELADYLNRVRQPFNTSRMAQTGALAALRDRDHVARTLRVNAEGRDQLLSALRRRGLAVPDSVTNFLLIEVPAEDGRSGAEVVEALLHHGVIVRPMGAYGLARHFRVTIGLPDQNARFLEALGEVLGEVSR